MTILPPVPGEPRRPHGPRDPGDAWVVSETGEQYWGRFGAAGLVAWDASRGVLLQHRVAWSHFGGTWGIPGGARHQGEGAVDAALREAREEAGVPEPAVRPVFASVLDLDVWTYTTVVAEVVEQFDAFIADPESNALEWVPLDDVDDRPLHPGFAASWPALRAAMESAAVGVRPVVVVDAANVVGSVPDGWWKDRAGAARRLHERVVGLAGEGVAGESFGLADIAGNRTSWYPEYVVVLEGAARSEVADAPLVSVVLARAEGDDTIVDEVRRAADAGRTVLVVTSDRALRDRAVAAGAAGIVGVRRFLDTLEG